MKIKNVRVYGLDTSIARSAYPMQTGEPLEFEGFREDNPSVDLQEKDHVRARKLANSPIGSGHDNFLKGVIVQFDLRYPQYWTPQLQRYHWFEIISSQSKMHKLTSVDNILLSSNRFVLCSIANELNYLIRVYNKESFPYNYTDNSGEDIIIDSKEECFQYIVSNLPMGYEMWMGISTNYLQLKTIYNQRKNHKLEDWREFCRFIESLPNSRDLLIQ